MWSQIPTLSPTKYVWLLLCTVSYLAVTLVTVATVERANSVLKGLPSPTIQNPEIHLRDIIAPPFQYPGSATQYFKYNVSRLEMIDLCQLLGSIPTSNLYYIPECYTGTIGTQ